MPGRLYVDRRPNLLCHQIVAYIAQEQRDNGWMRAAPAQLAQALGRARSTLVPWLQSLVEWGYLDRRGSGRETGWRVILDPSDEAAARAVLAEEPASEGVGDPDTFVHEREPSVEGSDTVGTSDSVGDPDKFIDSQQEVSEVPTGVGDPDTSDHIDIYNLPTKGMRLRTSSHHSDSGRIESESRARASPEKLDRCLAEAGPWLADPSKSLGLIRSGVSHIRKWEAAGADFELDILPIVIELTQHPPGNGEPIETFAYFTKAVRAAAAERMAPVEPITPEEVSRGTRGRRRPRYDVSAEFERILHEVDSGQSGVPDRAR